MIIKVKYFAIGILLVSFLATVDAQEDQKLKISPSNLDMWRFEGKGQWNVKKNILQITENSINRDPYSAPSARAIYTGRTFSSFELTAEIKSNAPMEETRADIIVIFGYQSPTEYYYAHLTGMSDSLHNGILIVDNSDRRKVDFTEFEPVLIDRAWHKIRLIRNPDSGTITIYKDNEKTPVITVVDKTFLEGSIGFGSYNDTGEIRRIRIMALD
jgi:hypothetical protein